MKAGTRLAAVDLSALASCGVVRPAVSSRPRIAHLVTGNELIDPAQVPVGSKIRDSNSTLIAALIADHDAELLKQSRVSDDPALLSRALADAGEFDVLLISGGASVGDYDYARPLLEKAGFEVLFHNVNVRPGKPLLFARRGRELAFALPGNPVSHAVIFHLFLAPLLAAMAGAPSAQALLDGRLTADLSFRSNMRETYWPCRVRLEKEGFRLQPLQFKSSGDVGGVAGANGFFQIPAGQRGLIKQDDVVPFLWLQSIS